MYYWYINQRDSEIEIRVSEQQNVPEEGVAASGESECISSVIDAIRTNAVVTEAAVDKVKLVIDLGPEKLTEDVLRQLETHLDKQIFFGVFESDSPELSAIGNPIAARNRVIPHYNVDTKANDFEPWSALMRAYVESSQVGLNDPSIYDYFGMMHSGKEYMNDFAAMGAKGLAAYVNVAYDRSDGNSLSFGWVDLMSIRDQLNFLHTAQRRDDAGDAGEDEKIDDGHENLQPLPFLELTLMGFNDNDLDLSDTTDRALLQRLLLNNRQLHRVEVVLGNVGKSTAAINELLDFIKRENICTIVSLFDPDNQEQRLLNNAVARNRLQHNIRKLRAIVKHENGVEVESVVATHVSIKYGKIRLAKLDPRKSISTKHQYQHHQVAAQQQQQKAEQRWLMQRKQQARDDFSAYSSIGSGATLVDCNSIPKELRSRLAVNLFKGRKHSGKYVEAWWKSLVGKIEAHGSLGQKIDFISMPAILEAINHPDHFKYGLNLDNLPLGFYIAVQDDTKHTVLCYNPYRFKHNSNYSPLTISYRERLPWPESHRDVTCFVDVSKKQSKKQNLKLLNNDLANAQSKRGDRGVSVADQQQSLFNLMQAENKGAADRALYNDITNDFDKSNYVALFGVFANYGCYGVNVFLEKMRLIKAKDNDLYKVFKHCFLNNSEDYSEFLTNDALAALDKLAAKNGFDKVKLVWWNNLVLQHFRSNQKVMVQDLLAAFEYFCDEFEGMGLKLPKAFSLEDVKDMRVGLDRLLYILKMTTKPEEQLHKLSGLGLESDGAYFAVRYNGFSFVSAAMKLTNEHLLDPDVLSYKINMQQLYEICAHESDMDNVLHYFYRYIGKQEFFLDIDSYESMVEVLRTSSLPDLLKVRMLPILAAATTGESNYRRADVRAVRELLNCLQSIYSEERDNQDFLFHDNKLKALLEIFSICSLQEPAPNLASLKEMVEVLREYSWEKVQTYRNIANKISSNETFSSAEKSSLLKMILFTKNDKGSFDDLLAALLSLRESGYAAFQNVLLVLPTIDPAYVLPNVSDLLSIVDNVSWSVEHFGSEVVTTDIVRKALVENLPGVRFRADNGTEMRDVSEKLVAELMPDIEKFAPGAGIDVGLIKKQLESGDAPQMAAAMETLMQAVQKRLGPAANYFMKRALNSYVKIHKKVLLDVIKKLDLGGNEGIRAKLIKFIEKQFGETKLNMEDPFASYNESQAKYGTLNKFISVVKKANRRWPQELTDIVNFALDLNGDSFDVRTDVLEALLKLDDAHVFIRPVLDLFATVNFEFSDNDKERLRSGVSYLVQSDNKLGVSHFKMLLSLLLVNLQSEDIILGLRNLCALKLAYGDDLFVALLDLVAEHGLQVLDVAQIKKLLGETDEDKTNANPKIELLKGFLSLFQPDTARLNEALRVINAHASSAMILEIVVRSCLLEKECTAEELFELIGFLQEKDEGFIADLARQYDAKPYPARGRLLVGLRGQDVDVKQFIADYERDPFGTRNDYLVGQFDVTNARRVVNEVNDIKKEKRLSASARRQLLNDFNYINDIGCKPKIRSDGALVKVAVKDFTHEKIVIQMEHCKNVLRNPESSKRDNAKARLEYLALLREVMYRTTGKFPYSTQIITVLNAFMQSGSVLSEVNTGEGKSIVSALNAAMLWVEGQSVDVCSSDLVLSERDFEKFKDFYDYLGIEATFVSASSPSTAYKIGGVNYSDVANLSLFRSRAKITGVRLRTIGESKLPVSLVLDESDAAILDQRTLFNFSMNLDADIDPDINLDAWVYPLIVKFAQSEIFTNVNATVADDISNIRIYLQKNADIQQSRQLENISNEQLDRWLDSACAAQVLCEELDYVVCTEKRDIHGEVKTYSVARVLIGDRPSAQTKWSFGVHQLLHARLNAELAQEQPPFICEPETAYIDSRTSKNFIDYYGRKHGRILGMTGTIGSEAEIKLQHKNYGFSMFKIPPHRVSRRVDLLPKFENDLLGQAQAIRDIVATLDGENPMLVICKDIPSASQMHNELQNSQQLQGYTVQLVDGRQDADVERELIANASQNKTITIATPILGRGTDIIPESEDGLFVVQTFVDTHRATSQIRGRAGRQGEFGKTQEICSVGAMKKAVGSERIFPEYQQLADYLRSDAESLAAVARDRSEQIGEIKRAILWMADKWNIYFLESESEDDQLKNYGKKEALELRRDLNCDLDTSAKGESEQKSLQEFAVRYKKLSSDAWQKVHNKYAAKVAEVMGAEYQLPANLQQDVNSIGKIKPKKTYRKLPAEVVLTEAERIDKEIEVIEMFQKKNPLSRLLLSQIGKGPNVANNRAEMLLHCKPDSKAVAKYFLGSQRRRKDFKYSELLRIYDNYPAANKVIGARDRMLATKLEASILWRQVSKDPEVRKLLGIKPSSYKNVGEKLRGGVSASPVQESVKASSRQVLRDERNARHKQLNSVTTGRPRSSSEVFQVDAVAVKRGAVSKDDEIVPEIGFVCSQ